MLAVIAAFIEQSGGKPLTLKSVVAGGEQLIDQQRHLMTRVFGVEPHSKYSTSEVFDIASECVAHSGLHIAAEDMVVEIVNDDGMPVTRGQPGRVLVTNLHNYGMPLLRYDIGNTATLLAETCFCGRELPRLGGLFGRSNTHLYPRSGRRISAERLYLDRFRLFASHAVPIVQEDLDSVTMNLVLFTTQSFEELADLRKKVHDMFAANFEESIRFDVQFTDRITPGPTGKHTFVFSKVDPTTLRIETLTASVERALSSRDHRTNVDCRFSAACVTIGVAVTTVIDPEQPQRGQRGKRLLLVIGGSLAAVALIVAGACAIADEPDEQPASLQPQTFQGPFIAEASFLLQNCDTLTETERMSWQNLTLDEVISQGLPFTRYNRYYTRFFLKEGETVQITMESSVPLGTDLNTAQEGISVMLLPSNAPYGATQVHDYLPDTETEDGGYFARLTRAGGNWQIGWDIGALESDYYWLMLANTARQDAWCHFTVSVPSG